MPEQEPVTPEVSQPETETSSEEPQVASEAPLEATPTEESPKEETKVDWWNPDTWGETSPKDVIKNIQKEYDTKSKSIKQHEREYSELQSELQSTVGAIRTALQNPETYKQYRKQLGYSDPESASDAASRAVPQIDISKLETVEDLKGVLGNMQSWMENRIQSVERSAEAKAEQRIQAVASPIAKERWQSALDSMQEKYGEHWQQSSNKVVTSVTSGNIKYTPGNEKAVLDKAFRAECPEAYESYLTNSFASRAAAKASASTVSPKKSAPVDLPQGSDAGSVIARVIAKHGGNKLR